MEKDLELAEDMGFQRREWVFQRIGVRKPEPAFLRHGGNRIVIISAGKNVTFNLSVSLWPISTVTSGGNAGPYFGLSLEKCL